ncbi:hypothetical protein MMC18_001010 [Xylographa bjoerkii]|nr:hypothetical protein [Xylographa bjoerkii]
MSIVVPLYFSSPTLLIVQSVPLSVSIASFSPSDSPYIPCVQSPTAERALEANLSIIVAIMDYPAILGQLSFRNTILLSFAAAFGLLTLYGCGYLIYNLYFHPLARFPGPFWWRASRIPYVLALRKGTAVQLSKQFHDKYGCIVRLAPDELSFTDGDAWRDIYLHRQGHVTFQKNSLWLNKTMNNVDSIFSANDEDHARIKKLLNNSFSDKMLREQEPLVRRQIDLFIEQLHQQIAAGDALFNLTDWFHWLLFDIVGYLAFSESFDCLVADTNRPFVAILLGQFLYTTLSTSCRYFPGLAELMRKMTPKSALQRRADIFKRSQAKVQRRLDRTPDTPDFMGSVLRADGEKGMSVPEIESSFPLILIAGSETTATSLTGMGFHLVQNPHVWAQLAAEVRAFTTEAELNYASTEKMPYLNAFISEGLRMTAAVPWGHPREVPKGGDTVAGEWLPGGTVVYVNAYAAYNTAHNFAHPDVFDPARWLTGAPVPKAYEPFSVGARSCIGKKIALVEMRMIIARLVWNFDMVVPGGGHDLGYKWEDQHVWTLWVKRPLVVELRPTNAFNTYPSLSVAGKEENRGQAVRFPRISLPNPDLSSTETCYPFPLGFPISLSIRSFLASLRHTPHLLFQPSSPAQSLTALPSLSPTAPSALSHTLDPLIPLLGHTSLLRTPQDLKISPFPKPLPYRSFSAKVLALPGPKVHQRIE